MDSSSLFNLSTTLLGHKQDVRCLMSFTKVTDSQPVLVSGSRDGTVRFWQCHDKDSEDEAKGWFCSGVFGGHVGQVSCLAHVKQLAKFAPAMALSYANGLVASGGVDKVINLYEPVLAGFDENTRIGEATFSLAGHTDTVCALATDTAGQLIVSGSWDKTARVWHEFKEIACFRGHEYAVWSVLIVREPKSSNSVLDAIFATGSADKSIRLWSCANGGTCLSTISDAHSDCVRGLCPISPSQELASCANDASIKLWQIGATNKLQPIKTLPSLHSMFIYQIVNVQGRYLLSCSEDRSLGVWILKSGDVSLLQRIAYPALSVWCATGIIRDSSTSGLDIAVGGSDGIIRIFTTNHKRTAPAAAIEAFDAAIKAQEQQIAAKQQGGGSVASNNNSSSNAFDRKQLRPLTVLESSGSKVGQIVLTCQRPDDPNDVDIQAYEWDGNSWQLIGQVEVAPPQQAAPKVRFDEDGKFYDYVFDVDIAPNVIVKLPYNVGDNIWQVAEDFCAKYNLDSGAYKEQIVNFITSNSRTSNAKASASSATQKHVDPWHDDSYHASNVSANAPPFTLIKEAILFDEKIGNTAGWLQKMNLLLGQPSKEIEAFCSANVPLDVVRVKNFPLNVLLGSIKKLQENEQQQEIAFPLMDLMRLLVAARVTLTPTLFEDSSLMTSFLLDTLTRSVSLKIRNNVMLVLRALANLIATGRNDADSVMILSTLADQIESLVSFAANVGAGGDKIAAALFALLLNISIAISNGLVSTVAPSYSQLFSVILTCLGNGSLVKSSPEASEYLLKASGNGLKRLLIPSKVASNIVKMCQQQGAAQNLALLLKQIDQLASSS